MTGTVPEPREIGVKRPLALFRAGAWILTLIVSFAIFAMILVIDWRMQGHDGVAPPAWYTAPAKLMPTHIEGDAARGFCDLVSWVNAAREIDCSKDFPRTGATCFGDASAVFCDNGATIVATICWLCLYFAPLLLASVWR